MKLRSPMPELTGETAWINGQVKREELMGKPTIIHFWSISCHSCKESLSEVRFLREKYGNRIHFISVHMPRSKEDTNLEKIKKRALKYNMTQPIFVDSKLELSDRFHNQYVPSYYIFDRKGNLRYLQAGDSGLKLLEKRIVKLMNE
ncbi:TlpA family protein disulfide reductase [Lysinibacillus yapensis]|uniref:TlpA family protein disulfide reductase n=1 Tax=Ureibacillus yapensis TaxID=2304605 RepID=A0A396SEV4_9BACL|nr:TlpA family protein disulfide reductase [Lysinibacillus yapensis]